MSWDNAALLERARAGDDGACEALLTENVGLIWSVVRRYYGRGVDSEDLYQLGCLGFLKAVRGFEPAYNCQFSTYAVPKIAGEIRRFLRDDGTVKVSRTVKENALALRLARDRLSLSLGREPTLSELSGDTGLTVEDIAAADTASAAVASLQTETGQDGLTLEGLLSDGGAQEDAAVERMALQNAVRSLPQRERRVIFLRYYKDLTQERAARVLGVSQVQVSRIEKRAMEALRKLLKE